MDIGAYGAEGDVHIFRNSKFGKDILNDCQDFPDDTNVNGVKLPFFYIGDDAFPLCKRLMKPFAQKGLSDEERIFNYRLSRGRRCIENAFGIMSSKWLILRKTMFCSPDRAAKIIIACCVLHNYLLKDNSKIYCPSSYSDSLDSDGKIIEGEWRSRVARMPDSIFHGKLTNSTGRNTDESKRVRNIVKNYVNSAVGSLSWQRQSVFLKPKLN